MKNINKYLLFVIGYVFNAFGNALTVKGAVGTAMWTSAYENVAAFCGITVGTASSIIALTSYIVSKFIGKDFKIKDAAICLVLSVFFGTLIDFFLFLIGPTPSPNPFMNYAFAVAGILVITASVSITIYADVAYLALDDFLKNLRFYVFNENVVKATNTSLLIGFIITVTFGLLNGEILNLTVLTVVISLSFGFLINFFDIIFGFKKIKQKD